MPEQSQNKSIWDSLSGESRGVIIGGFFGILTLAITTFSDLLSKDYENDRKEIQMKREFEYELLMKVFGEKNKKEAAKQLEFFIDAGFLEDNNNRIKEMAKDPETIPSLFTTGLTNEFTMSKKDIDEFIINSSNYNSVTTGGIDSTLILKSLDLPEGFWKPKEN